MNKLFLLALVVLLILGCGDMATGKLGLVEVEGPIVNSKKVLEDLEKFEHNPVTKGVLVVVNSPGGGVGPSQEIFEGIIDLKDAGKKVVVYMSSVAASGGYYLSLPADRIVALPSTMTGSIGVILSFPVYRDLMNKIGIQVHTIKSRENKDIGSGSRYPTVQDSLLLQGLIEDIYQQFVEEVVKWRKLPYDSVYAIADGRVITGRQAYALGLVDTLGSRRDAHKILAELCGYNDLPKLTEIPKKKSFWEEFVESRLGIKNLLAPSLRYELNFN